MILGGYGQECLAIPKEAIETLRSQKLKKLILINNQVEIDFVHAASYLLKF